MIEVINLTKRYGDKIAVNRNTFTINKGEVVGFLGPNGAGKTTVMNMITGYISYNEGTVRVGGFDVLEQPLLAKRQIGYLPEIPPLYPDMTVREYLNFVHDLKQCLFPKEAHINEICDITKLSDVEGRLISNLSKGFKQRVGLAQALIGNPEILILDEPTVGLDPKEIIEIRNLIKRLGINHTVILSSHILSEVQAICERIIIINNGYLVKDATTEELLNSGTANNRYGIRLAAPEDQVVPVIAAFDGVVKVEYVGMFEKGTVDIIVESEKRIDIRRILFAECAKRDWYILMITPLGISLEDIFIQLVNQTEEVKQIEGKTAEYQDNTKINDDEEPTVKEEKTKEVDE